MMEVGAPAVHSPDGVASRRTVGVSASVIFPCTTKSSRWWVIMKEVDKWCSNFSITVGTETRTAGILIYSWLNMLAANMSQPSGRLVVCWLNLVLQPSLAQNAVNRTSSHAMDLVVYANTSSSVWVWVGKCFFCYRLTRVVPNKEPLNGCVCVFY